MKRDLVVYCDNCPAKLESYQRGQERKAAAVAGWSFSLAPGHHAVDLCPRCNGKESRRDSGTDR